MADTVLNIQNVRQTVGVKGVDLKKSFGTRLRESAKEYKQEKLPNGDVKITLIIPGGKNG